MSKTATNGKKKGPCRSVYSKLEGVLDSFAQLACRRFEQQKIPVDPIDSYQALNHFVLVASTFCRSEDAARTDVFDEKWKDWFKSVGNKKKDKEMIKFFQKTFPASETADTDDDEEAKEEEDSTAETDDEEGEEGDDEGDEEEEGEESDGDEDEEGEDDEHEEESEAEETQVAPVPAAATPAPAKQPPLPAKRKTEDKEPADKKLRFEPKGKK